MRMLCLLLSLALVALAGCASREEDALAEPDWDQIEAEDFPYVLEAPGLDDPIGLYQRAVERYGPYRIVMVRGTWRPPYGKYPVAGLQVTASGGVLFGAGRAGNRLTESIVEYLGEREWRLLFPGRTRNRFGPVEYVRIVAEELDECLFFSQAWSGRRSIYMVDGFYCVPLEDGLDEALVQAVIEGVAEKKD